MPWWKRKRVFTQLPHVIQKPHSISIGHNPIFSSGLEHVLFNQVISRHADYSKARNNGAPSKSDRTLSTDSFQSGRKSFTKRRTALSWGRRPANRSSQGTTDS